MSDKQDEVRVELSAAAMARAGGDAAQQEKIREDTKHFWLQIRSGMLYDQYKALTMLRKGEVDLEARLYDEASISLEFQGATLSTHALSRGTSNAEFTRRLLDQAPQWSMIDTRPTTKVSASHFVPLQWARGMGKEQARSLVKAILKDERLQVEEAHSETLTPADNPTLINQAIAKVHERHLSKGKLSALDHFFVDKLLELGAVVSPRWMSDFSGPRRFQSIARNDVLPSLTKAMDGWLAEWQVWEKGGITPDTLSNANIRHFFSVGKAQEFFGDPRMTDAPERWLDAYAALPDWVQAQASLHREASVMLGKSCISGPAQH